MGGEGSGRKPDMVKSMMEQQVQKLTPIANNDLFLPNYSGLKPEARKTSITNSLLTASDDGTYITIYFNSTAIMRIEKATSQLQIPAGLDTDTSL